MKPATKATRRRALLAKKIADELFSLNGVYFGGWDHKLVVRHIKQLLEKYKV